MNVLAIDPGPEESALVLWDGERVLWFRGACLNESVLVVLGGSPDGHPFHRVAIEQMRGFGKLASDQTYDTCSWSGRFFERAEMRCREPRWVPRKEVSGHLCDSTGVSHDKYIREALIARFGGKQIAVGTKQRPGVLYGISGHLWAALAVAVVCWDKWKAEDHE